MKKILLSLMLICAFAVTKAQTVVFNEFYPNPDTLGGRNEYLELYNISGVSINLDCYSILAYDQTTHTGYVYQLPATPLIGPFGWIVFTNSTTGTITYGGGNTPSTYSGSNVVSWNTTDGGATSFLKKYTLVGNTLTPAASSTTTNDFLLDPSAGTGIALFLFNGSTLINGFIGNGSPALPADFASITSFPITTTSCGTVNINLSAITAGQIELQAVHAATGLDHGYYRKTNGLCGSWEKSSSGTEFSPGTTNGGTGATNFATVTIDPLTSTCNKVNGQVTATYNGSITVNDAIFNPSTYVIYEDLDGDHQINTLTDNLLLSGGINDLLTHNFGPFTFNYTHDLLVQVVAQQHCVIIFRNFRISCAALPVSFKSFTASRNHSDVLLKWETAWEQNSNGFAIERNIQGTWEQVAFVPSQAAGGNSMGALAYMFVDLNNVKGITQYRVRQVDFDNKFKYSDIRAVRGEGQAGNTVVYPNPSFDGRVSIVFEDATLIRDASLSDMAGRILKQWKGITNNNIQIDNLTPGMYSLRIVVPETGEQSVQKIIVSKR